MAWNDLTNPDAWKQAMANLLRRGGEVTDYIATAPEKAGQTILDAGERQRALMNKAFDPTGKTLIRDPQAANQAAMNLLEGPLGFAPAGIMIGPSSKLWNKEMAFTAAKLEKQGKTPQEIWEITNTYRGPEGEFRQEIADAPAKLKGYLTEGALFEGPTNQAISHNKLFESYPDLAEITTKYTGKSVREGSYRYDPLQLSDEKIAFSGGKDVLLHELQHAVQSRESFPSGYTAREMSTYLQQNHPDLYMELANKGRLTDSKLMHDLYERIAGEAEARMVQKRADYTPEQLKQNHPLKDYDVPVEELIYREAPQLNRKDLLKQLFEEKP